VIGASTFKLAVALELYCRAASDGLDVNQRIAFQADRSIASKASLREAAMMMMMMAVSDNAAADALIDLLGAETITTRLHQDGATHTTVRPGVQAEVRAITAELDPYAVAAGFDEWHDLYARHSSPAGLSGQQQQRLSAVTIPDNVRSQGRGAPTTARDMAVLVRAIWWDEAGPPTACAQVRELMSHQVVQRLARAFPDRADISVAAKGGRIPGLIRNDVGAICMPEALRRRSVRPRQSPVRRRRHHRRHSRAGGSCSHQMLATLNGLTAVVCAVAVRHPLTILLCCKTDLVPTAGRDSPKQGQPVPLAPA
jgi:beta-lactamase class A